MKKFIFIIILILALDSIILSSDVDFKLSSLRIQKTGKNSYSINFIVSYPPNSFLFSDTTVPITTEPLVISGKIVNNTINEQDFLYSAFNYDLNGDGDFDDVFKISNNRGSVSLNGQIIQAIIHPHKQKRMVLMKYIKDNGKENIYKISDKGNKFIIYSLVNNHISMGLGHKGKPLAIQNFPNPNVQIMLLKIQDRFTAPGYSIIDHKNYRTYSNEKIVRDQMDRWVSIVWSVLPLIMNDKSKNTVISAKIKNIEPPFLVYVFVNCSVAKGIRMRFGPWNSGVN